MIGKLYAPLRRYKAARLVRAIMKEGVVSKGDILELLPMYIPNSRGSVSQLADLTIVAAQQTVPMLCALFEGFGPSDADRTEIAEAASLCGGDKAGEAATETLGRLFLKHGSDKSRNHNYHAVYGVVLRNRASDKLRLLEIGLGTNFEDVISTMGAQGKPGASLRAFREFLPNAELFGADVDRRILFQEDRIQTFFVDQTDPQAFESLARAIPDKFDLIIDDGLHAPDANIATMMFALPRLRNGGHLIIEDIAPQALPVWKLAKALLHESYVSKIISIKDTKDVSQRCYAFLVQRV